MVLASNVGWILVGIAIGGFMLGIGLVVGAFVIRQLRQYMSENNGH